MTENYQSREASGICNPAAALVAVSCVLALVFFFRIGSTSCRTLIRPKVFAIALYRRGCRGIAVSRSTSRVGSRRGGTQLVALPIITDAAPYPALLAWNSVALDLTPMIRQRV